MPIELRCPSCGKTYQLADERAGKRATCPCGTVMKVPGKASKNPAWEAEVNRVFGASPGDEPREAKPGGAVARPAPNAKSGDKAARPAPIARRAPDSGEPHGAHGHEDVAMPPHKSRPTEAHGHEDVAMAPRPPRSIPSWAAGIAKINLRRLVKKEPWRAAFGLAAVAYGVCEVPMILSGISPAFLGTASVASLLDLMFGNTACCLGQAALAVAIAVGGLWILEKDKRGPACAGVAAAIYCFLPLWGVFPGLRAALATERLAPLLLFAAEYGVPVAIMVWCFKEETRGTRSKEEREPG